MDDRLTSIVIGGKEYPLMLNVYATKKIIEKYGGLTEVGEKMKDASYAEQLESVLWLLTTLINAGIMYCNYKTGEKNPSITQELVESLSVPSDFTDYRDAVFTAMNKGAERHVRSEEDIDSKNAVTA